MFLEELLLLLTFDFIFLEELVKQVVGVRLVFHLILAGPFHNRRVDPESIGGSNDSLEGEEGFMEVKEGSDE